MTWSGKHAWGRTLTGFALPLTIRPAHPVCPAVQAIGFEMRLGKRGAALPAIIPLGIMTKTALLPFLLTSALLSLPVGAATLPYSVTYPLAVAAIDLDISLPKFNTTLGTLNSAQLEVRGEVRFIFNAKNFADTSQTSTITSTTTLMLSSSNAELDAVFSGDTIELQATTGALPYAVGQIRSFGPFDEQGSVTFTAAQLAGLVASGAFSAAGSANFPLRCMSQARLDVRGGGGNILINQDTQARCSATVTYDYTPFASTPAPVPTLSQGALALLSLLLLGWGAITVRRENGKS